MFNVFGSNSNNWYSLDWQKPMQAELSPSAIKDNCAIVPLSFHLQLIIALIQDLFHVKHREKSKIKELSLKRWKFRVKSIYMDQWFMWRNQNLLLILLRPQLLFFSVSNYQLTTNYKQLSTSLLKSSIHFVQIKSSF